MPDHETGSDAWWEEKRRSGIPEIEPDGAGGYRVTFWWRDPQGDEQISPVRRVWLYITGVTDHHQQSAPQSLERLPGSDVWRWQTCLSAGWRGSYCLIPSEDNHDFSAAALQTPPDRTALRAGWRKLLPQAIADPFNSHSWRGGRGHATSALHMPEAPPQPGWDEPAPDFTPPRCIEWRSTRLGNQRRVWIFTAGAAPEGQRPLAILLDGQFWAQSMPVWPALEAQTRRGQLPPALYVLIDVIDTAHRARELPCNADFWLAVQQELLPLLRSLVSWREDPATTVVAGQSFGGLSALYAGLHWPQTFGCVLSQSGSYWWPRRDGSGQLIEELASGSVGQAPLRIYLEAGLREPLIHQAHSRLVPLLQRTQPSLIYRQIDGGHDALCWRGGLINGLSALWSPAIAPTPQQTH
ncbi:enterochelin esterase [Entomohabitans teleogrylli]|uniref:enterochelin esterase n=1 Tax=Entomohabitans teleogrylli TaxID=1384589 RepID=UPI00073D83C6|nr:enterochelin esterase [Entomohabitans teleogrylli]